VELLVALVLSKFAIVAVLALGGAALNHDVSHGATALLVGLVLVVLGAFAPWALLALLPLHELASGAIGSLRSQTRQLGGALAGADSRAYLAEDWIDRLPDRMRAAAGDADQFDRAAGARSTLAALADGASDPGPAAEAADSADAELDRFDHGATEAGSGSAPLDSAGPGTRADGGDGVAQPGGSAGNASGSGDGGGGGLDGATAGAGGRGAGEREEQRLPHLHPMYHQDDGGWRTLTLGPDDPGPPGPLWQPPARADDAGSGSAPAPAHDPRSDSSRPAEGVIPGAAAADDVDPLPPPQDSDQGRL
jgi:hypothetical protein